MAWHVELGDDADATVPGVPQKNHEGYLARSKAMWGFPKIRVPILGPLFYLGYIGVPLFWEIPMS